MTADQKRQRRKEKHQLQQEWFRLLRSVRVLGSFSTLSQIRQAAKTLNDRATSQSLKC